jgi:hypothetical protein
VLFRETEVVQLSTIETQTFGEGISQSRNALRGADERAFSVRRPDFFTPGNHGKSARQRAEVTFHS